MSVVAPKRTVGIPRALGRQLLLLGLLAVGTGLCAVVPAAPVKVLVGGGAPALAEERVLFGSDDMAWFRARTSPQFLTVRISPDGKRLLYSRPTEPPAANGERGGTYELWLREIDSGKDLRVPVPPCGRGFRSVHIRLDPFTADGSKMALSATRGGREVELVIFDIKEKALTPTGIKAAMTLALFDRSGKRLVVVAPGGQDMPPGPVVVDLPGFGRRPLDLGLSPRTYPTSACPAADVFSFFDVRPPPPGQRRGQTALVLGDLQEKANAVDLPVNPANTQLDDLMPVWTLDGRYICYHDQGADPELPKGTRIWDRVGKREMAFVPETSPMGTGPRPSQVVLVSTRTGDNHGVLLDVPSGKTWPLGDEKTRLLHAANGKMAYLRLLAGGAMELRVATIVFGEPPQ